LVGDAYENNREFSVLVKEKFCEFEEMVLNSKRPRSAAKKISERKEKTAKILPIKDIKLSENAAKVYSALKNGPKYTDEIKYETQMDLAGLLSAVCELEISGLIESLPGGRFKRA
jgi:predicted Rossmann fold nucleotide-binding protein DprA/Smf involved in DNA uptake